MKNLNLSVDNADIELVFKADEDLEIAHGYLRYEKKAGLFETFANPLSGFGSILGFEDKMINESQQNSSREKRHLLKIMNDYENKINELESRNEELNYQSKRQKGIISILAHDIRSPLNSIKNIIQFKQSFIIAAKDATAMMDIVSHQLNNTIEMVDNIVNWGKMNLQFGELNLKDFDLHDLTDTIFGSELLSSLAKNNVLINDIVPGTILCSDRQAWEFMLRNLISNAGKYTENGSIKVSLEKDGTKKVLCVTDTGVGMSEKQARELLEFNTYHTTLGTNQEKGSGLGLLLVKEFISRLDLSLTVESAINKGTSFKIVM